MENINKGERNWVFITNCNDCPLCNIDFEEGPSCSFPGNEVSQYEMPGHLDTWIPEKCPLLTAPLTIIKK
jgi:hypothetical protein